MNITEERGRICLISVLRRLVWSTLFTQACLSEYVGLITTKKMGSLHGIAIQNYPHDSDTVYTLNIRTPLLLTILVLNLEQLPANTQRRHNVASASPRRHNVAATSEQCCYDVVCLLGSSLLPVY